ncbi:hypothetical protein SAMN05421858_1818 [Haladaptatus litoreus]|uniref:DUF7344 domain-containing protein n=2 Tax=Haladaptatus litoreus TaxID=553468 RepID=A0A1N6Z0X9_9EURY|nr:hypothetical protein SAMN05421858_1818 [Haladaptatus litoreus]
MGADEAWTLTELATKVRAWELEVPKSEVPEREVELTYASLHHAHIPKLVDHEVIEYDDKTETISPGTNAEQVVAALAGAGASLDTNQEHHARSEMDDQND